MVGGQPPSLAVPADGPPAATEAFGARPQLPAEGRQADSTAPPDGRAQMAGVSRGAGSAVEFYRLRGARASRQVDLTVTCCWSLVVKLTVKV